MLLSIVIPTNGRRRLLEGAIASCLAQDLPADVPFEVLVVDNTPEGSARDVVASRSDSRVVWIHAPVPGVSDARNAGVRAARGVFIAFLDDDEEAGAGWAAALLAHARQGAVAVFGPIQACFEAPPTTCRPAAARMFSRDLGATDGADVTRRHAYLGTGNSLFHKAICFADDRPFDTELNGLGGEDSFFLKSLVARGIRLTWAGEAWVKEHVPADRVTLAALATRRFRNGQVRSLVRFRAPGLRKLEGIAWMCIGVAQMVVFGLASLVLAPFRPERAALFKLDAYGGAGKVLWMRPFWKLTYGGTTGAKMAAQPQPFPVASAGATSPLVSIIVVSYRTREMTLECLRSVMRETKQASYELIVVDNASDDQSAEAVAREFPSVRLMALTQNVGFAKANNMAAAEARGRYVLLLNPDTVVLDGGIDRLAAFAAERPAAKIWGGRTFYGDRSLNPSCWRHMTLWSVFCRTTGLSALLPSSRLFNPESCGRWDRSTVSEVDIVTGCFFLIEREFWQRLGGFDAKFFMYGEEADLCLRAAKLGARPAVTSAATIIHYGGASDRVRSEMMIKLLAAKAELIMQHWSAPSRRLGLALLQLWPLTRAVSLGLAGRILGRPVMKDQAATWRTIWDARARWRCGYSQQM